MFDFPMQLPEEAIKLMEMGSKAEMILSICLADDEFVKIGILQPITDFQLISQTCQMVGKNYPSIQKLQKYVNFNENTSYVEYVFLKEGFGFGVYQEGFNVILHFDFGLI